MPVGNRAGEEMNKPTAQERLDKIRALVDRQAEDAGLWFQARTAPEAYLQQELRKLHAVIEGEI